MGVGGKKGAVKVQEGGRRGGKRVRVCGGRGGLGGKQATHTHTQMAFFVKTALWFRQKRTVQIKNQEKYSEQVKKGAERTVVWQMQSTAAGATMEAHAKRRSALVCGGEGGTGEVRPWGSEVSNGVSAPPANRTAGGAPDSPDGCTVGLQIANFIIVFVQICVILLLFYCSDILTVL